MTFKQIIADIRNIATSGSNSVDFRIEDSQIAFWINETKAKLQAQAIQKRQDISTVWLQTIACLELEQGDTSECCNTTTDCKILRSVLTIPRTIETAGTDTIIRVETITGKIIPKTDQFSNKYGKYDKYTGDKVSWFLKNDRIYVEGTHFLTKVNVIGIFEDPRELAAYSDCEGNTCWSYTSNYPCSTKMASDITDIVLKTKVFPYLQLPQDTTNDGSSKPDSPVNTKGL